MPPLDKVYDYSQYGGLKVEKQDKVMTITLNAPESMNAFSAEMHYSMSRIWEDVQDDPEVNVVVLTGAGRAFSAGGNVIAMQQKIDRPELWDATSLPEAKRIIFRMLECDKPVIARVNGHAVGLGATVALMCDIIIAADTAKIGDPHVNAGLVAGDGGALIWPQLIGFARAKEYLFTGDLMTAAEAHRIGLINHVVPAGGARREGLRPCAAAGRRRDEVDPVDQAGDQHSAAADRACHDGSQPQPGDAVESVEGSPGGGVGICRETAAELHRRLAGPPRPKAV